MAPVNLAYTAGIETTKVAPLWLQKSNEVMDGLIVISNHAKKVFENTACEVELPGGQKFPYKLQKPCTVVNYPLKPQECVDLKLDLPYDFNFFLASQWGPRKNMENSICWWVEENIDREVGLVVKTNFFKNCTIDRDFTKQRLEALLAPYADRKCSVTLLHGYMSEKEMQSIYRHEKIKAMINIAHGEGFGLPLFDAAAAGLPIITVDWSGQTDFLYVPTKDKKGRIKPKSHFLKVEYDVLPVQQEAVWDGVIQADAKWAYPKEGSYKMALRKMLNNHDVYQGLANKLKVWTNEEFKPENQYSRFVEAMEPHLKTPDSWKAEIEDIIQYHE